MSGTDGNLKQIPVMVAGLREIQELHCDDGSGNCEACFFPGKEGDWQSVKHPCPTRKEADKALGETDG